MTTAASTLSPLALFILLFAAGTLQAEVVMPGILASDMVIQRDRPVTIWGWAGENEKVTVTLGGQVVASATGQGRQIPWKVQIPPQKAGKIPDIRIAGSTNTITLTNVLAGEVWLCAGQSNMAMTVDGTGPGQRIGAVQNAEQEVKLGDHPEIRFFTVTNGSAPAPAANPSGAWKTCSFTTVGTASAAAYFFGRTLQNALHVPVGLVIAANAATSAELWIDPQTIQGDAEFTQWMTRARALQAELKEAAAEDQKSHAAWAAQVAEAKKNNQPVPAPPRHRLTGAQQQDYDNATVMMSFGVLFNSKIHPLTPMAVGGVIWYQGESNGGRAPQYRHCLAKLIESWRQAFGQPFPFLIVQLAKIGMPVVDGSPYGCWPLVREAQMQVADTVANCGIATAIDIGDVHQIHPPNKQEVGRRLALVALKQVYGQKLVAGGPRFEHAQFEQGKAIVHFHKEGADQLVLRGPGGFQIAGDDRRFVPATAVVKDHDVEISAPSVPNPKAVRYAFLLGPETTLFNGDGLPAFPFRSDDWEVLKYKELK